MLVQKVKFNYLLRDRFLPTLGLLTIGLLLTMAVSLCKGAVPLSWNELWQALWHQGESINQTIIWELRLPRIIAAMVVGAALGMSGALLQGMLRNGLADPFVLGISAGAGLVAIAMITLGVVQTLVPIGAWVGAIATAILVYTLGYLGGGLSVERLILAGVAISSMFGAIQTTLLLLADDGRIQSALNWLIGSLNGRGWAEVNNVGPYVGMALIAGCLLARPLNLLNLGDDLASGLGTSLVRSRLAIGAVASLLAASAVSMAGLIGFVGLVVPHGVRLLVGSDYRWILPCSAIGGAWVADAGGFAVATRHGGITCGRSDSVARFAIIYLVTLSARSERLVMDNHDSYNLAEALLEARNLVGGYGKQTILQDVSLSLHKGEWLSLVGANGSGKSTLLKLCSRILTPQTGAVLLDGKAIHQQPANVVARQLAILPQQQTIPSGLTVRQLVSLGRTPHQPWWQWDLNAEDRQMVEIAIAQTQLTALSDRPVEQLSGGERQRAFLALTLAQNPQVLLLDEPTTFLDLHHQLELLELLKTLNQERQLSIITVLHDINLVMRYSDRLAMLKHGEIKAIGRSADVITPENLRQVFDVEAVTIITPVGLQICLLSPSHTLVKSRDVKPSPPSPLSH